MTVLSLSLSLFLQYIFDLQANLKSLKQKQGLKCQLQFSSVESFLFLPLVEQNTYCQHNYTIEKGTCNKTEPTLKHAKTQ